MNLRQITIKDQLELKKVYFDSIQSLDEKIYSQEQKRAWSSQAWNNPNFDKSIIKGKGWLISKIYTLFKTRYFAFIYNYFLKNYLSIIYFLVTNKN